MCITRFNCYYISLNWMYLMYVEVVLRNSQICYMCMSQCFIERLMTNMLLWVSLYIEHTNKAWQYLMSSDIFPKLVVTLLFLCICPFSSWCEMHYVFGLFICLCICTCQSGGILGPDCCWLFFHFFKFLTTDLEYSMWSRYDCVWQLVLSVVMLFCIGKCGHHVFELL